MQTLCLNLINERILFEFHFQQRKTCIVINVRLMVLKLKRIDLNAFGITIQVLAQPTLVIKFTAFMKPRHMKKKSALSFFSFSLSVLSQKKNMEN